jgi:hypothetical protein
MNGFKKIFIAGVIQGSHQDNTIHSQNYRQELRNLLVSVFPDSQIYDPFEGHENSIEYDDAKGRETFLSGVKAVLESDLVIAYLPHASLGTAIEVWESHKMGIPVWTISPMKTNWVVRFCSDKVFESIKDFAAYLQNHHSVVEN